ncbi:protein peste [Scaptodrosophila lebanonensis]|uniref:Protein peste n=1 Tax=Drosophila lebanonensis TaxID=7225 RepID=A0A6J2UCH9_DROLE|nr:protein peste [Scaptodrosophila lebanonensis]
MTSRHYMWRLAILALGFCSIAAGVYLFRNWIDIFTRMRGKEMALSPTSRAYDGWKISPLPLDFDVYLFNWTNPEDFYVGSGKKPRFEQLGPYRFREKPDKVDIAWHNQNSSISFRKKAFFFFDAEGSNGTLEDNITTVNTVAHAAALRTRVANFFETFAIKSALAVSEQRLTETKTAREWMFDGYDHPLVSTMVTVGKMFQVSLVPYDRVGFLYPRNGSADFEGYLNMYTGADDIRKMGQLYAWNNKTHTGAFDGECGNVYGSMGEFFPPNLTPKDHVSMFLPNLCRAVPLDYTETVSVHGVTAFKFSGTERAVDNGTLYPEETSCLCDNDTCGPVGVIYVGRCHHNTSLYMSYPHFYKADPSLLDAVEGLQPEKEKHEFFMTLEPNAGVPMDVGGGFQANYLLEPVQQVKIYQNIPRTFIPMMWAEERVRVTEEIAADIKLVPLIVLLGQIFTGVLLAVGLICVCWYPTRLFARFCHSDDPKDKMIALKPLAFGTNGPSASAPTCCQSTLNPNVGVRLLDYRRSSGVANTAVAKYDDDDVESNSSECSNSCGTERLINDSAQCPSTNVIIR